MSNDTPLKYCNKCKTEKPITEDYWYFLKNGRIGASCISCARATRKEQRARYKKNHQTYTAQKTMP